ncbi:APC family permease [Alcanivorax sp. IO_7]|nr:APC family permease [Alcanivorax sp. IO_7]
MAGYVGTLALYASAFGDYGASLLTGLSSSPVVPALLASVVLLAFLAINLTGAKLSGGVELAVVAVKLAILALFAVVGFTTVQPDHFTPCSTGAWSRHWRPWR